MSEEWEESFVPLSDPRAIPPPELVPEYIGNAQCDYCSKPIEKPLYVVKHVGRATHQWAFCDNLCHSMFYIQRLREAGL